MVLFNHVSITITDYVQFVIAEPALKIYLNGAHISTLHPSFNKQSRLNYLIGKAKRTKYPFGQDIYGMLSIQSLLLLFSLYFNYLFPSDWNTGVISEFSRNHRNSENPYIRHIRTNLRLILSLKYQSTQNFMFIFVIDFYETGQILIICMTAYQSRQLQQLKSFEIDASFKRVQGVIKEWEINAFIERYNKSKLAIFWRLP